MRSEGEELEYPFFEGDGSSSDEWRDYGATVNQQSVAKWHPKISSCGRNCGNGFASYGGNSSSGTKKYQRSNSSDGSNTGEGVKIAGGVIGFGDEIEFSEELKEMLPDEAGK
ncbi:hypothetical protein Tco_1147014 [Tanacetum coccineum]